MSGLAKRLNVPFGGECSKIPAELQWKFQTIARRSQRAMRYGALEGKKHKRYPYIPLHLGSFERLVRPLIKPCMHVIDVGCGAGDKLYAFHTFKKSLRITGIEYSAKLVMQAREICGKFAVVLCGNALKHDYAPYDLIYMYRPIVCVELQGKLQEQVMRTMKLGATLVVVYHEPINVRTRRYFPDLYKGWVKTEAYDPNAGEEYKGTAFWQLHASSASTAT